MEVDGLRNFIQVQLCLQHINFRTFSSFYKVGRYINYSFSVCKDQIFILNLLF